jgi:putative transposase
MNCVLRVTPNVKTVAASLRRQGLRQGLRKFKSVSYAHTACLCQKICWSRIFTPVARTSGQETSRLRTDEGWLYLAVVIDLWSRAVITTMSPRMTAQLACDALQMALWRRKRPRNVIVHTDRGGHTVQQIIRRN